MSFIFSIKKLAKKQVDFILYEGKADYLSALEPFIHFVQT